jgi:hypothetical protein
VFLCVQKIGVCVCVCVCVCVFVCIKELEAESQQQRRLRPFDATLIRKQSIVKYTRVNSAAEKSAVSIAKYTFLAVPSFEALEDARFCHRDEIHRGCILWFNDPRPCTTQHENFVRACYQRRGRVLPPGSRKASHGETENIAAACCPPCGTARPKLAVAWHSADILVSRSAAPLYPFSSRHARSQRGWTWRLCLIQ